MTSDLHARFAAGHKAVNGWCALPSAVTAEIMGRAGFDMMTVDLQHGLIDYQLALTMLQVLQGLGVTGHRVRGAPGIYVRLSDPSGHAVLTPAPGTDPFAGLGKIAALGIKVSNHRSYHGVALISLRDGQISHWREYQQTDGRSWIEFAGPTVFPGQA